MAFLSEHIPNETGAKT